MIKFVNSEHCKRGVHCQACRAENKFFRAGLLNRGIIDDIAFKCPYGVPWGGCVDDRTSEPVIERAARATPRKQGKPRKPAPVTFLKCEFYNPDYSLERKSDSQCGCMMIQCRYNFITEIKSRLCFGEKCDNFAAVSPDELEKRKTDFQKKLLKKPEDSIL